MFRVESDWTLPLDEDDVLPNVLILLAFQRVCEDFNNKLITKTTPLNYRLFLDSFHKILVGFINNLITSRSVEQTTERNRKEQSSDIVGIPT